MAQMKKLKPYVDFLYEVGILNLTPRSGLRHLGGYKQSIAEHNHRMLFIALVLAEFEKEKGKKINLEKLLMMVMMHDFAEARALDLDWISQKYNTSDEDRAIKDAVKNLSFGDRLSSLYEEYKERKTTEAILAKEADHLELLLTLREIQETGNKQAIDWIKPSLKRLQTDAGKKLAKEILKTNPSDWWYADKEDPYWITGGKVKK
jgi:putative hydrolases of HD superfamily